MNPSCVSHRSSTCTFCNLLAGFRFDPFKRAALSLSDARAQPTIRVPRIYLRPSDEVAHEKFEGGGGGEGERGCFLPLGGREGALKFLARCGTPVALASFKSAVAARGKSFITNLPRARPSLLRLPLPLKHDRCSKSLQDEFTSSGRSFALNQGSLLAAEDARIIPMRASR